MKKRMLSTSLILSLILSLLIPTVALADDSQGIDAQGTVTGITPGDVSPIGNSGRWRVDERQLTGVLSGDINGAFTVTYQATIESLQTQAGKFRGVLEAGSIVLKVKGRIEPLTMVSADWLGTGEAFELPMLSIGGAWKLTGEAKGKGSLSGWLVFVPTEDGHVGWVVASEFILAGVWHADSDDGETEVDSDDDVDGNDDDEDDEDGDDDKDDDKDGHKGKNGKGKGRR